MVNSDKTIQGTLNNQSYLSGSWGTLNISGSFLNNGYFELFGNLNNTGTINNTYYLYSYGNLDNSGTLSNHGELYNYGTFQVPVVYPHQINILVYMP